MKNEKSETSAASPLQSGVMPTVPDVTNLDMAFGTTKDLPKWEDIPDEFKGGSTKWNKFFSACFFGGVKDLELFPKEGVDGGKALACVRAHMVSFEPKHEHKEAGCAYMLSLWLDDIKWA